MGIPKQKNHHPMGNGSARRLAKWGGGETGALLGFSFQNIQNSGGSGFVLREKRLVKIIAGIIQEKKHGQQRFLFFPAHMEQKPAGLLQKSMAVNEELFVFPAEILLHPLVDAGASAAQMMRFLCTQQVFKRAAIASVVNRKGVEAAGTGTDFVDAAAVSLEVQP